MRVEKIRTGSGRYIYDVRYDDVTIRFKSGDTALYIDSILAPDVNKVTRVDKNNAFDAIVSYECHRS